MFNNYNLIQKNKLLVNLTNVTKKHDPACFKFSFNNVKQLKTKVSYYSQTTMASTLIGKIPRAQKFRSVKNATVDWHCTKPLGKNELGLWVSFITQPFSTRKHWWILLPAQDLLFRLRWESSQSNNLLSANIGNVTSLNWFSEKPVYFYVVIPFLGCLGLISGELGKLSGTRHNQVIPWENEYFPRTQDSNNLKELKLNKKISFSGDPSSSLQFSFKRIGQKEDNNSNISVMSSFSLLPFATWQQIQPNKAILDNNPIISQVSTNSLNASQDPYIGTYSNSKCYLNYLNSSKLFQNLNSKLESVEKRTVPLQKSRAFGFENSTNFIFDIFNNSKQFSPNLLSRDPKSSSTSWNQYLFQKSEIYWFWSKWGLRDLKQKNSRFIWEKVNASSDYKLNIDSRASLSSSKNDLPFLFKKNTSFNFSYPGTNHLISFSNKSCFTKWNPLVSNSLFTQKLFSIDLRFPKNILINEKSWDNQFWENFRTGKTQVFQESSSQNGEKKKVNFFLQSFSVYPGSIFFKKINTLKSSSENLNFILINGLQKKFVLNSYENGQFSQNQFFNIVSSVDSFAKYFTTAFFLDNFFIKFYLPNIKNQPSQKFGSDTVRPISTIGAIEPAKSEFSHLPPYFSDILRKLNTSGTSNKTVAIGVERSEELSSGKFDNKKFQFLKPYYEAAKFKKLNFPILFSGYLNSHSIKYSAFFNTNQRDELNSASNREKSKKTSLMEYSSSKNLTTQSQLPLISSFINNTTKSNGRTEKYSENLNPDYLDKDSVGSFQVDPIATLTSIGKNSAQVPYDSTTFKWRSAGNISFYWNYFKHFYGAPSLLKPWSSTFYEINVQKPSKNLISNILFKKLFSPFKSLNVFPDQNFLFNKWHSKKKQGFFYKRITKLQLKKQNSQTSYSRVVSLLWGFRAKYKLDEVLQYQKSKYYQSKKAQQTAHQNVNQNTTSTNLNNQLVMKTLTKRRRYKNYLELNVLSSWLRDVLYFKKMGRKLVKIKKDTYLFNHLDEHKIGKKRSGASFKGFESWRNVSPSRMHNETMNSNSVSWGQSFDWRNSNKFEIKKPVKTDLYSAISSSIRKKENKLIASVPHYFSIKKGYKSNFDFEQDFLESQSLNSTKNLFMTLKNFSKFNKFNIEKYKLKNAYSNKFQALYKYASSKNIVENYYGSFPKIAEKRSEDSFLKVFGFKQFYQGRFLINKTPPVLKKITLTFSNKRFFGNQSVLSSGKMHEKKSDNSSFFFPARKFSHFGFKQNRESKRQKLTLQLVPVSISNLLKNFNSFFYSFQINLINIPSFNKTNIQSFVQLDNKQNLVSYKFTKVKNPLRLNEISVLEDSKLWESGRRETRIANFSYLSSKLKTNLRSSLFNKVSNFSSTVSKPLQFSSPFNFEKRIVQPLINIQEKLYNTTNSNSRFSFFFNTNLGSFFPWSSILLKFKNLSSSFVIWRNKFQIRRDYLLLSYIYLDYLGTLINSFQIGQINSNYFLQSEFYKTNLIKPCWSFSLINHLKTNHIGVYEQLLNSSDEFNLVKDNTLGNNRSEFWTSSISNFGVLPKKSISSFINQTSSVSFIHSIKFSNKFFTNSLNSGPMSLGTTVGLSHYNWWDQKNKLFSFPDSTTFNKNYYNYKTKLFNQKLILLKKQKLISSFTKGLKQVKPNVNVTLENNFPLETWRTGSSSLLSSRNHLFKGDGTSLFHGAQTIQWSKFKYRRKAGIFKTRILNKETKIYNGILFQNLGIHLEQSIDSLGMSHETYAPLTFWLCTVIFHLCLLSSLITTYKVSLHFSLKTLYSSLFILNKYFVYTKYRIQRLITYIYRNNFENFIENIDTSISMLKTQSFSIANRINFSFKAFQYSDLLSPLLSSSHEKQNKFSKISLNNNPFSKLFFLPYSYAANSKNQTFFSTSYKSLPLLEPKNQPSNNRDDFSSSVGSFRLSQIFKLKLLTLVQYIQYKYNTPFSNLQLDWEHSLINAKLHRKKASVDKMVGQKLRDQLKVNPLYVSSQEKMLDENIGATKMVSEQKSGSITTFTMWQNKLKMSFLEPKMGKKTSFLKAEKKIFPIFLKGLSQSSGTNIKLYFKVLKWNMLLTLLIGESEVLAELEPYREMHWYFLKKFPVFLRTSTTKDYLSMADYQADEKIRIIKQKIRQTIMILYLRTRKYESKLQTRGTQSDKNTNYLVRNRLNQKKLGGSAIIKKPLTSDKKNKNLTIENKDNLQPNSKMSKTSPLNSLENILTFSFKFFRAFQENKRRRPKIKKLSFWKSLLTFLGKYSFLSRSAILSKRFRESLLLFSYPLVPFGPIGTIFLTYGLKKFILDFEQNYYQQSQPTIGIPVQIFDKKIKLEKAESTPRSVLKKLMSGENGLFPTIQDPSQIHGDQEVDKLNLYILKKMTNQIKLEQKTIPNAKNLDGFQIAKTPLSGVQNNSQSVITLDFFTDLQKFVKKYNRVYFSLTNNLNKPNENAINESNIRKLSLTNNKFRSKDMQTLKVSDFFDWSYNEKFNRLGKNSIYSDNFDPKLRYYRFSTNFSKVLSDVGGFYTNIAAQQELGPIICKVYTGLFAKQSAKNYLLVSGSTNHEAVLFLIQALSAEMGMKLFLEDAKRLQRIGRRGINKATKRLEKLFDIAQANSPSLVFIEDIHVIGAKTKMVKVDEEQDDVEILSRSLLSKLVYRKFHKNKSLRESFIDQNLFTAASSSTRRRSLKPTNPIPTSLVLYQLTRRRALSNFFKSQENPARRLNNKLFLSKKLSPAFTTNAVLIWKLFKSKIATPNKRIKEAPWYHIPVDAMRSINPLTYSIRVKVAKITLLAIFTMGTRLRLVKDLIRLFEKIQFESYQNFIVFATTNKLSTLDPNLRRPGRLEETISLEGLTGSISSSRSPSFMTALDTFKVHLKNVPGFSKTFNVIDNSLFSTNLNLKEWTVINYFAENAYYSLDNFKNPIGQSAGLTGTNFTPIDFSNRTYTSSNKALKFMLFSTLPSNRKLSDLNSQLMCHWENSLSRCSEKLVQQYQSSDFAGIPQLPWENLNFHRNGHKRIFMSYTQSENQRMTSFETKNRINSPFSLFSNQTSGSTSTSSYWQSLFSNIILQRKTGLFTFNNTHKISENLPFSIFNYYKTDKFNLFLTFAYSRSGQSLISFLVRSRNNVKIFTSFGFWENGNFSSQKSSEVGKLTFYNNPERNNTWFPKRGSEMLGNQSITLETKSLMFDSNYLMNLQLWPEIVNIMSFKKSNIFTKQRQNLHASFLKFFASKIGEFLFTNSVVWTKSIKDDLNFKNSFNIVQNRFSMQPNSGLHNIYNTTSSWSGAYASIKNVVTTSALYSKTPLLAKLLRLEDVSKPRQKQFFESLNAGMLFEYSDFHYRAFFKKNNLSTEENLNLLIYQKYMLNNQGRPLRKYVKLENSNRLWLFRILYTELGSLDNISLNPTSMNYYYRNKIALKQVFKISSYQWWNWHLRKPLEQLEDIQEIAYFPCENKYYTPRRRRWILTNGFWGYWFSFDKNFYFDLYEQYMLQTLHFACLQVDKNREVLDYLAKLYIYKEKLSETDIIFALKRYQI